ERRSLQMWSCWCAGLLVEERGIRYGLQQHAAGVSWSHQQSSTQVVEELPFRRLDRAVGDGDTNDCSEEGLLTLRSQDVGELAHMSQKRTDVEVHHVIVDETVLDGLVEHRLELVPCHRARFS